VSSQAAAAEVALSVLVADDVPTIVHVDSEKVAWAVTTLVRNALRYVEARSRRAAHGTISVCVTFDPSNSVMTIDVEDDGPGIPADTVARLFARDGLNVRGAGLVLLVMSDVCAGHGGRIDVKSQVEPDHGTRVRLTIPTTL
jgi:signal transduction histidine kinase